MTSEERAAKLAAALGAAENPQPMIAEAIRAAVAEERERCARIAETDDEPDDRMPWRYRLRYLLRPERLARAVMQAVRFTIAERIRAS
jgi:hypothetical protein